MNSDDDEFKILLGRIGNRGRSESFVNQVLPEHEIRSALEREVDTERWTRLDVAIRMAADDTGFIDLRPDQHGAGDPEVRRLAVGRLQKLERMGLAAAAGPGQWMVGLDAERTLRDLGVQRDIIKTMHRAFTERGQDRGIADYVIDSGTASSPIIGRLVVTGLHDELTAGDRRRRRSRPPRALPRDRGLRACATCRWHRRGPSVRWPRRSLADPGARQPLGHRPRPAGDGAGRDLARLPPGRT
jgi:hypothetical protein